MLFRSLDNGNKQYGQGRMTACLKRDPSLAVAGFEVTEEQLQAQARRQREVQSSLLSGTSLPPLPPSLQNAERVMRSINLVETSLRGSDKEREDMRRTMYAMTFQYGPPHFMLTVTPSDSANGMVATIACGNDTDQVNELFPKEFNVTDKATVERTIKIQKLATKDPAASAQLFMEIVEEILTNILGFDVKRHTSRQGLAGEVEWYGGGIENQELALLHCHLGIRIKNWPQWLKNMQSSSVTSHQRTASLRISAPRIMPRSTEDDAARKRNERSFAAQVAAQHKRTVQDAVFPTSDADRKRVTRSVAAQVAAQHKRTVQDAVFPTSSAERMRFIHMTS